MNLKTKYELGVIPHAEHPMPQMERESWLCLNGPWALTRIKTDGFEESLGDILVPFSPETENSGIARGFCLAIGEKLVYRRHVTLDRMLLRGTLFFKFLDSLVKGFTSVDN